MTRNDFVTQTGVDVEVRSIDGSDKLIVRFGDDANVLTHVDALRLVGALLEAIGGSSVEALLVNLQEAYDALGHAGVSAHLAAVARSAIRCCVEGLGGKVS